MGIITILRPGKDKEVIERSSPPSLEEVQHWVGEGKKAYVQLLNIRYEGKPAQFYTDEDGLYKADLLVNQPATQLLLAQDYPPLLAPPGIKGAVVILQGKDVIWH